MRDLFYLNREAPLVTNILVVAASYTQAMYSTEVNVGGTNGRSKLDKVRGARMSFEMVSNSK